MSNTVTPPTTFSNTSISVPVTTITSTTGANIAGAAQIQSPVNSISVTGYCEGLERLALELGVSPVEEGANGAGICMRDKNGKRYSMIAIIQAHLDLMKELNIIAAHTDLLGTPE